MLPECDKPLPATEIMKYIIISHTFITFKHSYLFSVIFNFGPYFNLKKMETNSAVKQKSQELIPQKVLCSYQLKCINFPFYTVLFFIMFWFIISPLIFVEWSKIYGLSVQWACYYWIGSFITFIIIILLVMPWKPQLCKYMKCNIKQCEKNKNQDHCHEIPLEMLGKERLKETISSTPGVHLPRQMMLSEAIEFRNPQKLVKVFSGDDHLKHTRSSENLTDFNRCSELLSPRELYFQELLQNSKSCDSIPRCWTDTEKCQNSMYGDLNSEPVSNCGVDRSSVEFFIANVPDSENLATEIFLYIDGSKSDEEFRVTSME